MNYFQVLLDRVDVGVEVLVFGKDGFTLHLDEFALFDGFVELFRDFVFLGFDDHLFFEDL